MSLSNIVRRPMKMLSAVLIAQKKEFSCGECYRWQRCGLPPTACCIAREEQIARRPEDAIVRYVPSELA